MPTDKIEILIEAKVKEAIKGLNKVQKDSKNVGKESEGLVSTVRSSWLAITGIVATATVAIKKAFDFAHEFNQFQQSAQAMEKQFGVSSDAMIKKLKEVSDGTLSSTAIVESANRAMALNVTKDIGQMADLLEVARVRGRAMGIDTEQAFNDLVTGIGRRSPLILDNLGIITKGWDKEAKAAGVAMDTQFILNKVLEDGAAILEKTGELALTNAEATQKAAAEWEDLKLTIGELVAGPVAKIESSFAKVFETLRKSLVLATEDMGKFWEFLDASARIELERLVERIMLIPRALKAVFQRVPFDFKEEMLKVEVTYNELQETLKEITFGIEEERRVEAQKTDIVLTQLKEKDVEDTKKAERQKREFQRATANAALDLQRSVFDVMDTMRDRKLEADIHAAEGQEEKIRKLKRDAFKKQKFADTLSSIINTAVAVTKTLTALPFPLSAIPAGLVAAAGAAQTSIIASQPVPSFARGGSFITNGPQMIQVGDNPGGRERVDITPINNNTTNDNRQNVINVTATDSVEFINDLKRRYGVEI